MDPSFRYHHGIWNAFKPVMIVWLRQVVVVLKLCRIPFGSLILTLDFGLFFSMLPNREIELGDLLIREQ